MTAGFQMWIQDRTGGDITKLSALTQKIVDAANKDPKLMMVRTTLNTRTPQYYLTVDREKAKSMNVNLADLFSTLNSTLSRSYVNDFNLYSRVFHVNISSLDEYRKDLNSLNSIF
jgi:multidrug efflux pump subunit AcrB